MNTLSNALPIVAAAYGRKFAVPVVVGGDTAGTDGATIHLPTVPDEPGTKSLAWGYLAHEAGHVRHTDFGVWNTVVGQPLLRTLTNILEDVRIENAMIGTYPGTRQTLDAVMEWMLAEGQVAAPTAQDNPPALFAKALLVLARHRYRQQACLEGIAKESEQVLRDVFPARFVHRLLGLMVEIRSLQSTADSAALAKRMVDLMQQEAEPPDPEPEEDEDNSSSEDSPEADTGSEQDQGPSSNAQEPGAQNEDDVQEHGTQSGMEDDAEEPGTESLADSAQGDGPTQALRAVLAAGQDDLPKDVFEAVAEALSGACHGTATTLLPSLEDYAGDHQQGMALLMHAKEASVRLSTRLQGLVQAHTLSRERSVSWGRSLCAARLHRVAVGDGRIFARKDAKQAPNTALHLLVDLSGSMAGGDDRLALEAAMALALALEPISGVSRAVTAFPGMSGVDGKVTRILSHGDTARRRAGAFIQRGRGSTPMTGALWFAAADLIPRPEERKVILVLTDGAPDDWDSAAKVIGRIKTAGIELIGIGIQQDVHWLFPVAIRIDAIGDLTGELFRIAEELLLR